MMTKPRPRTAWIVAKKVRIVATPGTGLHGETSGTIDDNPVSDNQVYRIFKPGVIYSNV